MTIRRLLKASRLAGLQEVEQRLNRAYRDVLRSLHLVDRNDPVAEIVAKTVIEIGATGVREPSEISKIALKRLAQLGRPRLEAPTGQEIFEWARLAKAFFANLTPALLSQFDPVLGEAQPSLSITRVGRSLRHLVACLSLAAAVFWIRAASHQRFTNSIQQWCAGTSIPSAM